jgi:hypothetical protein
MIIIYFSKFEKKGVFAMCEFVCKKIKMRKSYQA